VTDVCALSIISGLLSFAFVVPFLIFYGRGCVYGTVGGLVVARACEGTFSSKRSPPLCMVLVGDTFSRSSLDV